MTQIKTMIKISGTDNLITMNAKYYKHIYLCILKTRGCVFENYEVDLQIHSNLGINNQQQ